MEGDVQDRPRVWLLGMLLALPLLGLVLLLAVPSVDVMWEHHPSHFLLVLAVALINVALALVASDAAHRRADARLFLVSLALITSSGFLALHALATPGVLLDHPNSGSSSRPRSVCSWPQGSRPRRPSSSATRMRRGSCDAGR